MYQTHWSTVGCPSAWLRMHTKCKAYQQTIDIETYRGISKVQKGWDSKTRYGSLDSDQTRSVSGQLQLDCRLVSLCVVVEYRCTYVCNNQSLATKDIRVRMEMEGPLIGWDTAEKREFRPIGLGYGDLARHRETHNCSSWGQLVVSKAIGTLAHIVYTKHTLHTSYTHYTHIWYTHSTTH